MIKRTAIFLMVLIFVLVCKESAFAQNHVVGVRGGYSWGTINFDPNRLTILDDGNYEGAITYTYNGFQKYYGSLQTELIYSQRGFKYEEAEDSPMIYTRKITSVEVPFLWRPYYTFSKDRGLVYALLGIYAYYDISSKVIQVNKDDPDDIYNMKYDWEYDSLRDNRLGVGVIGGVGFGWNIVKNLRFSVEGRYAYAFSNVFTPAAKYKYNPVQSTPSKIIVSVGLTYSINTSRK